MIPGLRTALGQVLGINRTPTEADPRLGGFTLTDEGQVILDSAPGGWYPSDLFLNGEQGGLWDFTDLSNLYQDSAGTTPVTAVGDPIGLVLDTKNGMTVTTSSPSTADLTNSQWVKYLATTTGNQVTFTAQYGSIGNSGFFAVNTPAASIGKITVTLDIEHVSGNTNLSTVFRDSSASGGNSILPMTLTSGQRSTVVQNYVYTGNVPSTLGEILLVQDRNASNFAVVKLHGVTFAYIPGNHASQSTSTNRPVLGQMPATGVRNLLVNTATLSTQNVTTDAGSYTIQFTGAGSVTASGTYSGALTNGQTFTCTAGTLTLTVSGSVTAAQLEAGSTATAKQVVGAAYDVTESGVASVYAGYADGVDDALVTNSVDFSATDKMTVWAGYRRVSPSADQQLMELRSAYTLGGAFALYADYTGTNNTLGRSGATSAGQTISPSLGTPTNVLFSGQLDLAGITALTECPTFRINGSTPTRTEVGADTGGGNFSNAALYLASRNNGASSHYKGFISALCTRGAASDPDEVNAMEEWLAERTPGVVLAGGRNVLPPGWSHANGFTFTDEGKLYVQPASVGIDAWAGGLPFAADGGLIVQAGVPPDGTPIVGGVAVDENGVYIESANPTFSAFDTGFSGGFS